MKKPDFKKALNEILPKPASERTQAVMDRLIDNVLTNGKQSKSID